MGIVEVEELLIVFSRNGVGEESAIDFCLHDVCTIERFIYPNLANDHFTAIGYWLEPTLVAQDGLNLPAIDGIRVAFNTLRLSALFGSGFGETLLFCDAAFLFDEWRFHLLTNLWLQVERYQFLGFEHVPSYRSPCR